MTPRKPLLQFALGSYLALAFSLLSLFLTLILTLVIDVAVSRQIKANIGINLAELAAQTTNQLDRSMFERYREVQLIAERMGQDMGSLQQRRDTLDALQRTYPYYAWIGMTDNQGRVLTATGGLLAGADVSSRPWFRNAYREVYVGDVHEAVLLAKLLPNPTNEPKRFVDVAFPYRDAQDRVAGILGAHISWAWASDIVQSILAPVFQERRVEVVIAGADGRILLGRPEQQGQPLPTTLMAGAGASDLATQVTWPDGKDYLVAVSQSKGHGSYPGLGWRVLVLQQVDQAYAPVGLLRQQVLWGGVGIGALFSLLALLAARAITRPLQMLSQAARRMETGELQAIDPGGAVYTEVQALGDALNSLLTTLQTKEGDLMQLNATLENRVEQRTAVLTDLLATVRENEHRVRTIVETAQGAFIGMNFEGKVVGWNTQAENMLGWKREQVVGRALFPMLIPPRFMAPSERAFQDFLANDQAGFLNRRMERIVLTADGRELPVEMNIGLINTPRLKFFSAFLYDISERKEVERMKSEFISTVSHELRTPLTGIYGSLSLLVSGMAGDLPDDVKKLLDISHQSTERLIRLINDVLDVERIESNNMRYRLVVQPLRPLVEQAMRATQAFADPYQVQLVLDDDPADAVVYVDADRIIQVVVNLLSNAAKFSPPGGAEVDVTLSLRPGQVRLSVTDHGMGIADAFRDRVFQRFAQGDSSDRRQQGGTGLGLSICKSIVEAHGGQIGFVSAPGQGSTFYVDLPLAVDAAAPA